MKKILMGSVLTVAMTLPMAAPAFAGTAQNDVVSAQLAEKAAKYAVLKDRKVDKDSLWATHAVHFETPIPAYGTSDTVISYIVNLTDKGQPIGSVEISADEDSYPVISFTKDAVGKMTDANVSSLRGKRNGKGKAVKSEKVVATGAGEFALKTDYTDGSAELGVMGHDAKKIDAKDNHPTVKEKRANDDQERNLWQNVDDNVITGDLGNDHDGATDDLSFESSYSVTSQYSITNSVPDISQYNSSLWSNGASGCAPTTGVAIMQYWANQKGKTYLTSGLSLDQQIQSMRTEMSTYESDGAGYTNLGDIPLGMQNYAIDHGYYATNETQTNVTSGSWSTVTNDIKIGPSLISFIDQEYYCPYDTVNQRDQGHTVAGVGYVTYSDGHQYMEIHDNWSSTAKSTYVIYGSHYKTLYSCNFLVK